MAIKVIFVMLKEANIDKSQYMEYINRIIKIANISQETLKEKAKANAKKGRKKEIKEEEKEE